MPTELLYQVADGSRGRDSQISIVLSSERLAEEKGEGIVPAKRVMMGEPTKTVDLSSQELMDTGLTVREPALD